MKEWMSSFEMGGSWGADHVKEKRIITTPRLTWRPWSMTLQVVSMLGISDVLWSVKGNLIMFVSQMQEPLKMVLHKSPKSGPHQGRSRGCQGRISMGKVKHVATQMTMLLCMAL